MKCQIHNLVCSFFNCIAPDYISVLISYFLVHNALKSLISECCILNQPSTGKMVVCSVLIICLCDILNSVLAGRRPGLQGVFVSTSESRPSANLGE